MKGVAPKFDAFIVRLFLKPLSMAEIFLVKGHQIS